MKTRKVGTPKTTASQKKTPPARKSAARIPASNSTGYSHEPPVEQGKTPAEGSATKGTPTASTTKKVTNRIVKKKVIRPKTPASASASASAAKADESDELKAKEVAKDEDTTVEKDLEVPGKEETVMKDAESAKHEEQDVPKTNDDQEAQDKGKAKLDVDELSDIDPNLAAHTEQLYQYLDRKKLQNLKDEQKPEITDDDQKPQDMEEEGAQLNDDDAPAAEVFEECGIEEGFVEPGQEDLQEDDETESVDEFKASDEEHKELAAAAKEHEIKKEGFDWQVIKCVCVCSSYNPPKTRKVRSLELEVQALEAESRGTKRRRLGKSNVVVPYDSKSSGGSGSSRRGGTSAPPTLVTPPLKQSGGTMETPRSYESSGAHTTGGVESSASATTVVVLGTKEPSGSDGPIWSGAFILVPEKKTFEGIELYPYGDPDTAPSVSQFPGLVRFVAVPRRYFAAQTDEFSYYLYPGREKSFEAAYRALLEYLESREVVLRSDSSDGTLWVSSSRWLTSSESKQKSFLWGVFAPNAA